MIKEKMLAINNDSVLIGEVWEDASNKVSYSERRRYFFGEELDSVTNYPLRDIIIKFLMGDIKAEYFTKRLVSLYENYPIENFYSGMNLLGNHDTERILTILNEDINLLTLALVMQMTLPGVPLIYYGDEAGLKGGRDPENRKTYPWGNENKEILSIYKSLGNLRYKEEILKKGELKVNLKENKYLVYERVYRNEKITIILNPYNQSINYKVNESEVNYYDLKSTQWMKNENKNLVLDSYGFKIFKSNLR